MDAHDGLGRSEKGPRRRPSFSWIREALGLLVSVLAIIAFIRTCSHEDALKNLNYDVLSLTYQPRLSVAATPAPSRIVVDTLSVTLRRNQKRGADVATTSDTLDLRFELTVHSPITIVNASEGHLAKVLAVMSTDTIPDPKAFITGRDALRRGEYHYQQWPRHTKSHVLPGDTLTIMTETKVRYINDRTYVIHIVVVYQNELGHLYHTHAMLPYTLVQRGWRPKQDTPVSLAEEVLRRRVRSLIVDGELMRGLPPVNVYETYSQTEAEMAKKNLERIMPGIGP